MVAATQPAATLQQILKGCGAAAPHPHVQKVRQQLLNCRTAANGYHLYQCSSDDCRHLAYQYHSCRNRHCPQCGALKKEEWIEARRLELLPVKYYHVVFTLPHELNSIVLGNRSQLFKLLFDASAQTLLTFGADTQYLGARPGVISVLHTWGQQLSFHPHVHCIVSGGGIVQEQGCIRWVEGKKNDWRFLFPVKAMNKVFRGKFLQGLTALLANQSVQPSANADMASLINELYQKDWIVYAKQPFGGPQQVIEYLGRYTHKVAISNHRIQAYDADTHTVTFDWKDYADGSKQKQMALTDSEFIRRFEQHILPQGFTKIRSYGYLTNRGRRQRINQMLEAMQLPQHPQQVKVPWQVRLLERFGKRANECPCCHQQTLTLLTVVFPKPRLIAPG
jgi:hypothetical protein